MSILDNKANLGSILIPTGTGNDIRCYTGFSVQPITSATPIFNVDATTENVTIGNGGGTVTAINTTITQSFIALTGVASSYVILAGDYMVHVVSNTYNTLTLPTATGAGGKVYLISRDLTNTNNNLVIVPQGGQNIESASQFAISVAGSSVQVISNNINTWYII